MMNEKDQSLSRETIIVGYFLPKIVSEYDDEGNILGSWIITFRGEVMERDQAIDTIGRLWDFHNAQGEEA